jgi:hypothetical protein
MKNTFEYGIICSPEDEKKIVKNINSFMEKEYGYRKIRKMQQESLLSARLPFVYTHFYSQSLKQGARWYFELYPNRDIEGKTKFEANPDAGWLLWINKQSYDSLENITELDQFFDELLAATSFETILLHSYEEGEERL